MILTALPVWNVWGCQMSTDGKAVCQKKSVSEAENRQSEKTRLESILEKMKAQTSRLKSYQAQIEYLFIQSPELLDSRTLRKGNLYYKKDDRQSKLRINFETLRQDDGEQEKYVEQYIFDGVWLVKIDYQLEQVDFYQQADVNEPCDVFEFISSRFPMIGFTKIGDLDKQFDIMDVSGSQTGPNSLIHLEMKVKTDSIYKDNYTKIDFWIDNGSFLPARVRAISTEGDIQDIQFLKAEVNKNLKNSVFKLETPKHFSKNTYHK